MTDYKKPIDDLAKDVKEYVELKTEDVRLKTAKGLSVAVSRILAALVILFVLGLVLLALTVAFILLLGQVTGNYALGSLIALGVFIVALVVLFIFRKKMFTSTFVKLFIPIFFPDDYE